VTTPLQLVFRFRPSQYRLAGSRTPPDAGRNRHPESQDPLGGGIFAQTEFGVQNFNGMSGLRYVCGKNSGPGNREQLFLGGCAETSNRGGLVHLYVEHGKEPCNLDQVVDALGEMNQLQFAVRAADGRIGAD
jgi:hypothetical protein